MSKLLEALDKIVHWLEGNYPSETSFAPGLTREKIESMIKGFPFKLPQEVYELYQYCNPDGDGVELAPDICFLSLERALNWCRFSLGSEIVSYLSFTWDAYNSLVESGEANYLIAKISSAKTCELPLLQGSGQYHFGVFCHREKKEFSPVYYRDLGREAEIYSPSLTN